jgi:hypothetical protein
MIGCAFFHVVVLLAGWFDVWGIYCTFEIMAGEQLAGRSVQAAAPHPSPLPVKNGERESLPIFPQLTG